MTLNHFLSPLPKFSVFILSAGLLSLSACCSNSQTACDAKAAPAAEAPSAQAPAAPAAPAALNGKSTVDENGVIMLPPPDLNAGLPLMQAIAKRKSSRSYGSEMISDQALSDLVWSAAGINRPESGGITIPTAMGSKEIDVFVMTQEGVYAYLPDKHALTPVIKGDHRSIAGKQEFAAAAPVTLFLVADQSRMKVKDEEAQKSFGAMTVAYASENLYLYCAAKGLSTVARAAIDKDALSELLKLRPEQKLLLAQSVGYAPANN